MVFASGHATRIFRQGWRQVKASLEAPSGSFVAGGATFVLVGAGACMVTLHSVDHDVRPRDTTSAPCTVKIRNLPLQTSETHCDAADLHQFDTEYPTGYTELERFLQALEYHRSLLFDYTRRWELEDAAHASSSSNGSPSTNSSTTAWPRHVPDARDVPALEMDLKFCEASPSYRGNRRTCQNLQFRLASFYVAQTQDSKTQRKGFLIVKGLAEHGHPDGMCLYGASLVYAVCDFDADAAECVITSAASHPLSSVLAMILMDGRIPGVERKPEEAVIWFRRAVDLHRHIAATYELGIALYMGEGVVENPEYGLRLFRQAAHLGHAGAAYMLGECLLDGVGCERDRASALEWLLTAAELGHSLARERALVVLLGDYEQLDPDEIEEGRREEAIKWLDNQSEEVVINLERRHTIGAGGINRSAAIQERRKSKVQESRDE